MNPQELKSIDTVHILIGGRKMTISFQESGQQVDQVTMFAEGGEAKIWLGILLRLYQVTKINVDNAGVSILLEAK